MHSILKNITMKYPFIRSKKAPYLMLGLLFLLTYVFIDPTVDGFILQSYRIIIILLITGLAVWGTRRFVKGGLDTKSTIFLFIVIGTLIRLVYVLYTSWDTRQYDVVFPNGHKDYILYLANHLSLPNSNAYQFSHPPLHHMISAFFYYVNNFLNVSDGRILEGFQLITAFYSSSVMVVSYRVFQKMKLKAPFLMAAMAIICFHPIFFMLGGGINNDMLAVLLVFSTILWLMKWYERPSYYNICFLALCLGLAMMAKISTAVLAFVIAPIFCMKMFSYPKPFRQWHLFGQFIAFGALSIPLGMWHPIRNLTLFGQKLGYVHPIDLNDPLFTGHYPLFQRLFSIPTDLMARLYCDSRESFNLPVYLLKSSLFGEFQFNHDMRSFAVVLILLNAILIVFSLISMAYVVVYDKRPEKRLPKVILLLLWITQMAAFVYFNIRYPFGCSMDFRYIVPTLLSGAGFIAILCEHVSLRKPNLWKRFRKPVFLTIASFCLFSSIFYLLN